MGCLNSGQGFRFTNANIHLSGPCNRSCYFCIGQHMMDLDSENNLSEWPLKGIDRFVEKCLEHNVRDIFLTGTNTDPLLYRHTYSLKEFLRKAIAGSRLGIRTNAAKFGSQISDFHMFDMGSITICSFDPFIYRKMMGSGFPPDIENIVYLCRESYGWTEPPKVNVVLGPENTGLTLRASGDILNTIFRCKFAGVKRINLREPYGQPHVGNPLESFSDYRIDDVYGQPTYDICGVHVTYWDVHYCEIETVNLYANGRVSVDYPITRGYSDSGDVKDQSNFTHGRHREQWVKLRKKTDVD